MTTTLNRANASSFITSGFAGKRFEADMKSEFLFALLGVKKIGDLASTPESAIHLAVLKDSLGTIVRESYDEAVRDFIDEVLMPFLFVKPNREIKFSSKEACASWIIKQFGRYLGVTSPLIEVSKDTVALREAITFLKGYTSESLGVIPLF